MPNPIDLLVLCELNPDVIVRMGASERVRFNQVEQLVDTAALTLGGSGAITASAAAAQGVQTAVCGVLGADRSGAAVREMLDGFGVDTTLVRCDPTLSTGMTVVLTRPGGDRAMLTFSGAIAALRVADVPAQALASARHIHISSIHLQTALVAGLGELLASRPRGVTASLDPGWDPSEEWSVVGELLPHLDVLMPNEAECLAIAAALQPALESGALSDAGQACDRDRAVEVAAAAIAALGPVVVVKCGARGAVSVAPDGVVIRVAGGVRTPVDTTGAGDNFDAGYLAAMLDGAHPGAALARGAASGAISVGGIGGTAAMASAADAVDLAQRLTVHLRPASPPRAAVNPAAPKASAASFSPVVSTVQEIT